MLRAGAPPVNPRVEEDPKSFRLNIMPRHDAKRALDWRRQETYVGGSRRDTPVDRITVHAPRGSPRDVEVVPRGCPPGHRVPARGHLRQDPRAGQAALPRGHRRPHARGRVTGRRVRAPRGRAAPARAPSAGGLDDRPRLARGRGVRADAGGRPLALPRADAGARLARRPSRPAQRPPHGLEVRRLRRDGRARRDGPRGGPRERGGLLRRRRPEGPALDARRAARRKLAAAPRPLRSRAGEDAPRPDGHPRPARRPRLRRRAAGRGRPAERGRHRGPHVRDRARGRPPRGPQEDPVSDAHADGREDRASRGHPARCDRADARTDGARPALDGRARRDHGGTAAGCGRARSAACAARLAAAASDRRARGPARDRGVGQAPRVRAPAHLLRSGPHERDSLARGPGPPAAPARLRRRPRSRFRRSRRRPPSRRPLLRPRAESRRRSRAPRRATSRAPSRRSARRARPSAPPRPAPRTSRSRSRRRAPASPPCSRRRTSPASARSRASCRAAARVRPRGRSALSTTPAASRVS